jgi:hypothetical protein
MTSRARNGGKRRSEHDRDILPGKGYQWKGMSRKFYEDFQNSRPYFDLQTVQKAYAYLEADHISTLDKLQRNFQQNFIATFVEGESLFFASW